MLSNNMKNTIAHFLEKYDYSELITKRENGDFDSRIMTHIIQKDKFVLWYPTRTHTKKTDEIQRNPDVKVLLNGFTYGYSISLTGKAEVIYDEELRRDFWDDKLYFFFKDGPSDPEYCLIKFVPEKIEFLDVKKRNCVNF